MSAVPLSVLATSRRWQTNFLRIMPTVRTHAKVRFRRLNRTDQEEATAEAVASACVSYAKLTRQKKLARVYPSTIASYAVRTVHGGRHVGGHINSKDVLSPLAQQRRRFHVRSISPWDRQEGDWEDLILESRKVSPADQACFNLDFQEWLKAWSRRDRQIIFQLAAGHDTFVVAERFRISPARVSQLRRRYEDSWLLFQGMTGGRAAA